MLRDPKPAGSVRLAFWFAAALSLVAAARADEIARLQVTAVDAPAAVQPGQRVIVSLKLRVIDPGAVVVFKPVVSLASPAHGDSVFEVPDRQLTPWDWPAARKAGDVLPVTATIDVPVDFPAGDAELRFRVAHNAGGDAWKYEPIEDHDGKPLGDTLRVRVKIREGSGGGKTVEVPLVIPRIAPPTIDGKVEPAEWEKSAAVGTFVENSGNGAPRAQTRARVGCDDVKLYIAIECDEPAMDKVVREKKPGRDADVWTNECVEVLLNPPADRAGYIHLIVDILNQHYDALGNDPWGFNPPWESATQAGEKGWSVEIAIPFASLGVAPPKPGQHWLANLCRERHAQEELSAWRATHGQFASPGAFSTWAFGSLAEYLISQAGDLGAPARGWPDEMKTPAGQWQAQLSRWRDRVTRSSENMDAATFMSLSDELLTLRQQHAKLKLAAAKAGGQRFIVTRAAPYAAFDGSANESSAPLASIALTLLQDEHADLAFNILNLTDQPLVLRCSTRHGGNADNADFARLGISGLDILWQQAIGVAAADGRIVYDCIAPAPAGAIDIPPGKTAQVWLSVHAPLDATGAHEGQIVIQPIDMAGGDLIRLPLSATVVPLKLTENPPIHCFTWNFAGGIEQQPQWWAAHLRDLVSHGVDVCMVSSLNHLPRVQASADGSMPKELDFSKLDRLLDATRGLFRLYWINLDIFEKVQLRNDLIGLEFGSPAYERAFKQWFGQVLEHLRAKGLKSDQFMINPYDESLDERCQLMARWVKEVDPQVRIVIDCSTANLDVAKRMDALTDVWVPHYRQFFPAEMKPFHELLRSSGKPRWAYYYSEGSNEKTQEPSRYYLSKFWWAFANDVTGMGYWAQQYYGDPWYRQGWKESYDTALWYPIEGGVAPSRRWQAWRQGWQDYLLLSRVRESLRQRNDVDGLRTLEQKVADVVNFPGDTERADVARSWLKSVLPPAGNGK